MNLEKAKWNFKIIATAIVLILVAVLATFIYLMIFRQDIVPIGETYGSFWLKNISLLLAALGFAASALSSAYNALEQRQLRYMENYPFLEVFPILSVDALPIPVPKSDLPPELESFNKEYLQSVAPSQNHSPSEIDFRYLALAIRNVGKGFATRVTITGSVEVPGRGFPTKVFTVDRRFNLNPGTTFPFTLLPISGLPEYKVKISQVKCYGYFAEISDFAGGNEFKESYPYVVPPERMDTIFFDDFINVPAGLGWIMDFWGQWKSTEYNFVPMPSGNDHFMIFSGDGSLFEQFHHFNNQGGAHQDLMEIFAYGQTAKITARVRSVHNTTAKIQLWCSDLAPTPKNRYTNAIVPTQTWQEISMLYTSTQTPNLRVHLLYTPGEGQILVDNVKVEGLYT